MQPMNPNLGQAEQNLGGDIGSTFAKLAPLATSWHGPTENPSTNMESASSYTASPSVLDQFFGKMGAIGKESAHLVESAAEWSARQVATTVGGAALFVGRDVPNFITSAYDTYSISQQQDGINQQLHDATSKWQTGQITLSQYHSELKDINDQNLALANFNQDTQTKLNSVRSNIVSDYINFNAAVLTVVGGGIADAAKAGVSDTAKFLTSDAVTHIFKPVEDSIAKFAIDKQALSGMTQATQQALKATVTDSIIKTGADVTGQQIARTMAVNLALKYPITFNWLSGTGTELYKELSTGKYGDAAKTLGINTLMVLSGGPIGEAMKYGGKALSGTAAKVFGETAFLDELSKGHGLGVNDLYNVSKDNPERVAALKALEATNMDSAGGRAVTAAYQVINFMKVARPELFGPNADANAIMDEYTRWNRVQSDVTKTMTKEVGADAARKYVIGEWSARTANWVGSELTKPYMAMGENATYDVRDVLEAFEGLKALNPEASYSLSKNLSGRVIDAITKSKGSVAELSNNLRAIVASSEADVPEALAKRIQKEGNIVITPGDLKAPYNAGEDLKIKTSAEGAGGEFFTKTTQPLPVVGNMGAILTGLGLSPERAQQTTMDLFRANLGDNLKEITTRNLVGDVGAIEGSAEKDAQTIIQQISNHVNKINLKRAGYTARPPIMDWRQLTTKEIATATGSSMKSAEEIARAINQSMLSISWAERGAGQKIVDYAQSFRPGAKVSMNGYLRVQGAGRFAWNPFFKMKLAAKTEILSILEGGGWLGAKFNNALALIFGGSKYDLKGTTQMLEAKQMFGGIGYTGEAANEAVAAARTDSGRVLKAQKASISALINSQAEKFGMDVGDYIDNYPDNVRNTVESILHYNPKANFLNSPMARTINIAFFPFRFNVKVAGFMARALARQDPLTQVAVLHGLYQAHQFLTSDAGQAWYSQNSDVLALLTYFTPIETISAIAALGHISNEAVGSFGELGGLPIGFIPQILQAEGYDLSQKQAYVNPKTGQPSVNYIPQTDLAKLATGISTFIGSLFTYPGSEAGLPSKSKADYELGNALTGAKSTDWTQQTQTNLTPAQQQFEKVVQGLNANGQGFNNQPVQQTSIEHAAQIPAGTLKTPATNLIPRKAGGSAPKAKKTKKANEPVHLLPGQSSIGQA